MSLETYLRRPKAELHADDYELTTYELAVRNAHYAEVGVLTRLPFPDGRS
jgi:hypothetical protein